MNDTSGLFDSIQLKRTTISKKVVDHLKDLIFKGRILPGEKLPSEREMSELMNVSRNTVRESYKILATLGYVQIKHGQGVFVSDENASLDTWAATLFIKNEQIKELFEIRKVLETQCVKWVAERINDEQFAILQGFIERPLEADLAQVEVEKVFQADHDFHMTLAELTGNSILVRIMTNLIILMKEIHQETMHIPGRLLQSIEEHEKIVEAITQKDADGAQAAMLTHLNSVERALFEKKE